MLCSAADDVNSGNQFPLFKVLMLNVAMGTVFLHLSNFGLGLSLGSVADILNTGARAPTSAECTPCLPAQKGKWFGHTAWIWVMVILHWLFFLINRCHLYRWVAIVSWLNYLILAIDLKGSSTQHLVTLAFVPALNSSTMLLPMASGDIKNGDSSINLFSFNSVKVQLFTFFFFKLVSFILICHWSLSTFFNCSDQEQ